MLDRSTGISPRRSAQAARVTSTSGARLQRFHERAEVMPEETRSEAPLGQFLFDRLRAQIIEGAYPPGSRVPIEALKAEFGVSKQPIMEALRRLETIGLVEIEPRSGCRVRTYAPQEARDFFTVFASFEGEIAAAAALRHDAEHVHQLDEALALLHRVEHNADTDERGREYFVQHAC